MEKWVGVYKFVELAEPIQLHLNKKAEFRVLGTYTKKLKCAEYLVI